jgi:trimeric autotransporter adhesin
VGFRNPTVEEAARTVTRLLTLSEAESTAAGVSLQHTAAWNTAFAQLFSADTTATISTSTSSAPAARGNGKRKASATAAVAAAAAAAAATAAAATAATANSALPVLVRFVERGVSYRGLCRLLEIAVARKVTPRSPWLTAAAVRFAAEQIELDLDLQKVQELSELQLLVLVAMIRMERREKGAFTFQGACCAAAAHVATSADSASTVASVATTATSSTAFLSNSAVLECGALKLSHHIAQSALHSSA